MASLEDRVTALERAMRSFESTVGQNLELIAASAESQSTSRRRYEARPHNEAICWNCGHAGVVTVRKGEGEKAHESVAASCRVLHHMDNGNWIVPRRGHAGVIVDCVHWRPVAEEGPGSLVE